MIKHVFTLTMLLLLAFVTPALASDITPVKSKEMQGMFWEDQAKAIDRLMNDWVNGSSRSEMLDAIKDLLQAESGLLAYGLGFNDSRLYCRLARTIGTTDVERFVGLVFLQRMTDLGFPPETAQATFRGRNFRVGRPDGSDMTRITFN